MRIFKNIGCVAVATCLGLAATSCETEMDVSSNGDLDGFWQMTTADTLATGGQRNMLSEGVTWAFQGKLMEMRHVSVERFELYADNVICKFEVSGGKLHLYEFYYVLRNEEDPVVEELDGVSGFGVNRLHGEDFRIVTLSSDRLVLESQLLRLHFRKI